MKESIDHIRQLFPCRSLEHGRKLWRIWPTLDFKIGRITKPMKEISGIPADSTRSKATAHFSARLAPKFQRDSMMSGRRCLCHPGNQRVLAVTLKAHLSQAAQNWSHIFLFKRSQSCFWILVYCLLTLRKSSGAFTPGNRCAIRRMALERWIYILTA